LIFTSLNRKTYNIINSPTISYPTSWRLDPENIDKSEQSITPRRDQVPSVIHVHLSHVLSHYTYMVKLHLHRHKLHMHCQSEQHARSKKPTKSLKRSCRSTKCNSVTRKKCHYVFVKVFELQDYNKALFWPHGILRSVNSFRDIPR
jgi:hypothetical protein